MAWRGGVESHWGEMNKTTLCGQRYNPLGFQNVRYSPTALQGIRGGDGVHRPISSKRVETDETTKLSHLFLITSCAEGSGIAIWTSDVDGSA